ncbi:MAG: SsrA-binding protein [Porticoccaceae bacterium]|nr:MAG: SsrA-binding protein [Porticoccaceae bacterium]
MAKKSGKKTGGGTIAQNRRAFHDYFLEERLEAGLCLEGWEVKALREGKGNLSDSYVYFKDGEAWLLNARITPLSSASSHVAAEPTRSRKLLLSRREIDRLAGAVHQKGYTCVALSLYWKKHLVKCEIALARGKATHDKREAIKERDWQRQKQRLVRLAR